MIPEFPFKSIALCMSGGGYRAASFHLGAMSYLNRSQLDNEPLIERVTAISTVSGGTITGVLYALFKAREASFEDFYNHLVHQLKTKDLIKEGLAKLRLDGQWINPYKRHNLINAFAEIYNEAFTENANFGFLIDNPSHLDLYVFNATEFNHGVNFRFQNQGRMGNSFIQATEDFKKELKLADMIAASSCFPGGFEPIAFPDDFRHQDTPFLNAKVDVGGINEAGLMDGGIYDNQGIDAVLLSEKRNKMRYDLIIISDVSSPNMNNFSFSEIPEEKGILKNSIKSIIENGKKYLNLVLYLGIILLTGGLVLAFVSGFANNAGTGAGISIGIFGIVILLLYRMLGQRIHRMNNWFTNFLKKLIPDFYYQNLSALNLTDYSLAQYQPLVLDRAKSLLILLQDVFLKQIRRLNYAKIYDSKSYDNRRISNLSRELTEEQFESRTKKFQKYPGCPPEFRKLSHDEFMGSELKLIIEEAANFGTNLWFTEDDELNNMLEKLIIAGQSTMCFNLMVYIWDIKSNSSYQSLNDKIKSDIDQLEQNLIKDWETFRNKPGFMI